MSRKNTRKPSLQVTPRDERILRHLAVPSEVAQVDRLDFGGGYKKCAARLKRLYDAGHIIRLATPNRVYVYARKDAKPAPEELPHARALVESRIAFQEALREASGITPELRFSFEYGVHLGDRPGLARHSIRPDAVLQFEKDHRHATAFLEIDLGSERAASADPTTYSVRSKIEKYCAYFDDDAYRDDFPSKARGFRVLFAARDKRRIQGIRGACADLGDTDFIWYAVLEEILAGPGPLAAVWNHGDHVGVPLFTTISLPSSPPAEPEGGGDQPGDRPRESPGMQSPPLRFVSPDAPDSCSTSRAPSSK